MKRSIIAVLALALLGSAAPAFETAEQGWKEAYKLYSARKYKEAAPVFQKAADIAKKPQTKGNCLLYSGVCLYYAKQYDKAVALFQQVIDMEKAAPTTRAVAWRHLGYVLQRDKKTMEKALEAFQKAGELAGDDKNRARGIIAEAELLRRMKQGEKALAVYEKALALPKLRAYHKATALRAMGDAYAQMKQDEKACEYYAKAAEVKKVPPYYPCHALLRLGDARARLKQYDKAREAYQKCLAVAKIPTSIKKGAEAGLKRLEKAEGK